MPILARILKDRGILTEKQLQEAIQHQVLYGGRLGTSLFELGMITEEKLQDALARAHGLAAGGIDYREIDAGAVALVPRALAARHKVCPYKVKGKTLFLLMVDPSDHAGLAPGGIDYRDIEAAAVALVSRALASRHKVCPYKVKGKTLFLLMVDPSDHAGLARIGFSLGYIIKPMVVPEFRMIRLLRDHYDVDERWRFTDTHRRDAAPIMPLSEVEAAERLDAARTRDEVVNAIVGASHRYFRRVVFFIVREPWVLGWTGAGEGIDAALVSRLRIPLDEPSVFQSVTRDKTLFIGRFGAEPANQEFLRSIGKRPTTNAVLLPVAVKGRVVNLVFGDGGASANVKASLGGLLVLVQKAPRAYLRIIKQRIQETRQSSLPAGRAHMGESEP